MCHTYYKILFFALNILPAFKGDHTVKDQCAEPPLADINSHEESKSPPFSSFTWDELEEFPSENTHLSEKK